MSTVSHALPGALMRNGSPPWIATVVACLCSFIVVMDGAIVHVALPAMQQALNLTHVQQHWVVDAYLMMLGGFMLLASKASDLYGRRTLLLWGLTLFTGASLWGGLAPSGTTLLAARALQGLGAAVLATSPLAIIMAAHSKGPAQESAIGWWAACAAMGAAFGVVIGGGLTDILGWRSVMFVNVPPGLMLALFVYRHLSPSSAHRTTGKLDVTGALTSTAALASFLYALSQSVHMGWSSSQVQLSLGLALVMAWGFALIERRSQHALVPFSIFRVRNVPIGMAMVSGLGAVLTCSMFFLSQTLQRLDGRSAIDTGMALLPMALALAVAAIASRRLREAGVRHLPLIGGVTAAIGLFWLGNIPLHPQAAAELLLPSLLVGCGNGLVMMSATHAVLAGIPRESAGLAAGLQNSARQLGGAIGMAALATLAQSLSHAHGPGPAGELAGYHGAFIAAGAVSAFAALMSLLLRDAPNTP